MSLYVRPNDLGIRIAENPHASGKWMNRQIVLEDMEQEGDERLVVTA